MIRKRKEKEFEKEIGKYLGNAHRYEENLTRSFTHYCCTINIAFLAAQ